MKSSAAGTDLSWARLRRFMIMVETLVMHLTLSSGILKAASLLSSAYINMIKKNSTKTILYLSSRPGTLVLISPGYLEVSVSRSDDAGESGDVLLQHLVSVQVCLLVRMQRKHVELREDHPLHSFPAEKIFKTRLTLRFAR